MVNVKKRNYSIDLLRICACFMIIMDHTAGGFFVSKPYNRWWLLADLYFFLSKPAVALFFMISGSLLLKKEESIKDWLVKRVLRIVLVILIFTLPHELLTSDTKFSLAGYFKFVWSSSTGSFWYLYSYLGLMVTLPILRKLVKSLDEWEYILGFGLWLVFASVIPQLVVDYGFLPVNSNFSLGLYGGTGYVLFILGHYLANVATFRFERKEKLVCGALSVACIVYAAISTRYEFLNLDKVNNFLSLDRFDAITSIVPAVTLFLLAIKHNDSEMKMGIVISEVAKSTFGIYLLSDIGIKVLMPIYLKLLSFGINWAVSCVLYDITVFIILYAVVRVLRFVPGLKWLI